MMLLIALGLLYISGAVNSFVAMFACVALHDRGKEPSSGDFALWCLLGLVWPLVTWFFVIVLLLPKK